MKRQSSVDTSTTGRGYIDGQTGIHRRLGVDVATDYIVALATEIRGRRYCDEKVSTEQKTLKRGNIHAFPWIFPRFSVAKLITCTSGSKPRIEPSKLAIQNVALNLLHNAKYLHSIIFYKR